MKTEHRILALFLLVGAATWFVDALVDTAVFGYGPLVNAIFAPSAHETYMRSFTAGCVFLLGFFVSHTIRQRRANMERLAHQNLVLAGIRNVEQDLARCDSLGDLVQRACSDLVDTGAYASAWISLPGSMHGKPLTAQAGLGRRLAPVIHTTEVGSYPKCICSAIREDKVLVVEGPRHTCPGCELGSLYSDRGSMVASLSYAERIYGVVTVSLGPGLVADQQEQGLFKELALDISTAIHALDQEAQRKKAEGELHMARRRDAETGFKIQQLLLFQRPPEDIPGADIAAISIPSQQVDGDFYDFYQYNEQVFDVIVADVMGKGTAAALLGAATKSHFMRAISQLCTIPGCLGIPSPRDIVQHVHREMTRRLIDLESFVTVFYARFDLGEGKLTYVDCGHAKPIHRRAATGACEMLQGNNLFLGASETEVYEQQTTELGEGDLLLFYSDGIVEIENRQREQYGCDRLRDLVTKGDSLTPIQLIDRVVMEIISHGSAESPTDDLTCVAIRIKQVRPPPPVEEVEMEIISDPGELARLRSFILGLPRRLPLPLADELELNRLELAVNEAASNIMRHAYHGERQKAIRVEASAYANRLTIRLYHWGDPYDSQQAQERLLDARVGGFGLAIISKCVDRVRYFSGPDGSHYVELVKKFGKVKKENAYGNVR